METYDKCGPVDGVSEDNADTCVMVYETLEMCKTCLYDENNSFPQIFPLDENQNSPLHDNDNSHA